MLDTNCFDHILDCSLLPQLPAGVILVCTGVQRDEISRCQRPDRRQALLDLFDKIDPATQLASSMCFDIEGAGLDQACWNDSSQRFELMLVRLKAIDGKRESQKTLFNQLRDVTIAETALKAGITLVTEDRKLKKVMSEFGGHTINFQDFLALAGRS
jgi:predicted nucleic acid-binding protein